MIYPRAKIYSDGSHYIAIPHTTSHRKYCRKRKENVESKQANSSCEERKEVMSEKECFERIYAESEQLPKRERKEYIKDNMRPQFEDDQTAAMFVEENLARKKKNKIARMVRLIRKVNMHEFNYFCTFTYDDALMDEDKFREKLSNCIRHLASRKGWKYIGVWERSPIAQRLHFHGMFYIPENALVGEIIPLSDYSTKSHKRQIIYQNTYFKARFGRNDFKRIVRENKADCVAYLVKYIGKTGEKIVYSRGLNTYVQADILDDDVICHFGVDDRKLILYDDFKCIVDGCLIGQASHNTLSRLPKCN